MEFLNLLYTLLIGPLQLFFEIVYAVAYRFLNDPGLSIVFLSLAMNFMVLPLYRRADAMQEDERARVARMKPWTDHIKKTFKGDERFMMLQTYNRQNGYKQTDALKGSVSLLLEIPFFIAAYNYLSHLKLLDGVSFGPIADLGAPDALISIGAVTLNALPILMTAINLVSAAIYMKGMPVSSKVQMYGIAAIFLILLYNSPAGLVFYWTLNNVFSLVKNIFYKMKNPRKVLVALCSLVGLALLACAVIRPTATMHRQAFLVAAGVLMQLPLASKFLRRKRPAKLPIPDAGPVDDRVFLYSCIFLAVLTGLLIPSSVIGASPAEFINRATMESPLWDVAESTCLAVGTFVIWFGVFYRLATPRGKAVMAALMFALAGVAIVDYLFFGTGYGTLSPALEIESFSSSRLEKLANLLVVALAGAVLVLLYRAKPAIAKGACLSLCVAGVVMSGVNLVQIQGVVDESIGSIAAAKAQAPQSVLSKNGKNVVVIMMDRAMSSFVPYLFAEDPTLKDSFAGFTFYPNATSYGVYTNVGSPALYGGYDYTPENMNARSDELMEDKQDEALKVMPRLFSQNGFRTTVFDPTYAGYGMVPDVSIYDDCPGVSAYLTMQGQFKLDEFADIQPDSTGGVTETLARDSFCYSVMKISPLVAHGPLYDAARYNSTQNLRSRVPTVEEAQEEGEWITPQYILGESVSVGLDGKFVNAFSALEHLRQLTPVEDSDQDTFLMMSNDTTHEPMLLSEPDYRPSMVVDNVEYDLEHRYRYTEEGDVLYLPEGEFDSGLSRIMHYQTNMIAMRTLADWLNYLRENDVYDNTRIIIVSDHGRYLHIDEDFVTHELPDDPDQADGQDLQAFQSLLLVKDFGSSEFSVDTSFMTNADTPTLALADLVDNPVNPYTGNPIDSSAKQGEQHLLYLHDFTAYKDEYTFRPGLWYSVHDDIHDRGNWQYLGDY